MKYEVIVPNVGESITEVFIGTWLKKTGDFVKKGEVLVDLETQKTSFELSAEHSGRIEILFPEPETKVKPGDIIATIDVGVEEKAEPTTRKAPTLHAVSSAVSTPGEPPLTPAARKIAAEKNLDVKALQGSGKGGLVLKEDVLEMERPSGGPPDLRGRAPSPPPKAPVPTINYQLDRERGERIEPASRIRRTIAQNLVAAQHTAAILTTFNEADMSQMMAFRKKFNDAFKAKYGTSISIINFFGRAVMRALKAFPIVNASFTGEEIIHRDFIDLSIAVSTDSGLVVPVLRDMEKLSVPEFDKKLADLSERARNKKLTIPEMTGGTFTISNGGVFGSLLSTPILNPPQSGILGLHKIQERPVVVNNQIVIRPMMYLALSYDHRLIDGREAVSFLVNIKEGIENLDLIIKEEDLLL